MTPLYTAKRYPGNRNIFCVWYNGDLEDMPDSIRLGKEGRPKWALRVVRTENVAADAMFWAESFSENPPRKDNLNHD